MLALVDGAPHAGAGEADVNHPAWGAAVGGSPTWRPAGDENWDEAGDRGGAFGLDYGWGGSTAVYSSELITARGARDVEGSPVWLKIARP